MQRKAKKLFWFSLNFLPYQNKEKKKHLKANQIKRMKKSSQFFTDKNIVTKIKIVSFYSFA